MIITIPNKVSWRKTIGPDSFSHYNATNAKRILKTVTHHTRDAIEYSIEPLSRGHLSWFEPLYIEKISQKNNPQIFNLYETTLEKINRDYKILILLEQGIKIGAIIFSETNTDVNISYKIFADTWTASNLPAGPSLYADYILTEYGLQNNKTLVSHGKDRNGYGITSSIGLAIFKILLGYKPYLPKKYTLLTIDEEEISGDVLYFTSLANTPELIGNLYTTQTTHENWNRLQSYQDQVKINWIIR